MKQRILKPIIMLALLAGVGAVVMLLWNAIIPTVIGWGAVSYLQAVGLLVLCRLLFGSFSGIKGRTNATLQGDRDELKAKLKGMTKEEKRDYIRGYMKNEQ